MAYSESVNLYTVRMGNEYVVLTVEDIEGSYYELKKSSDLFLMYDEFVLQYGEKLEGLVMELYNVEQNNGLPVLICFNSDTYSYEIDSQSVHLSDKAVELLHEMANLGLQHYSQNVLIESGKVEFRMTYIIDENEEDADTCLYLGDFVIRFSREPLSKLEQQTMRYHSYKSTSWHLYSWIEDCYE